MKATITTGNRTITVNLNAPIDISIAYRAAEDGVRAWYLGPVQIEPVRGDGFVGSVKEGGSVNFRNITLNPHSHGTHTECVGHISTEDRSVNHAVQSFFHLARLVSITPETRGEDQVITLDQLEKALGFECPSAVVLRTLPNAPGKVTLNYSNTNPPYLEAAAAAWLRDSGVEHLLLDLPSVDREVDGGALAAHRAFWDYPDNTREHCTITEFIYVPEGVQDGDYLLDLQFAPIENDASPSRPVLYRIEG